MYLDYPSEHELIHSNKCLLKRTHGSVEASTFLHSTHFSISASGRGPCQIGPDVDIKNDGKTTVSNHSLPCPASGTLLLYSVFSFSQAISCRVLCKESIVRLDYQGTEIF